MIENIFTLPSQQGVENDLPEFEEKEVVDEDSYKDKVARTQQIGIGTKREITAPN